MNDHEMLARHFETHRAHLRAVALRMLGTADAAEEALRETRSRLTHGDGGTGGDVPAWLTDVVTRICLDMLRSRDRDIVTEPPGVEPWDDLRDEARAGEGPVAALAEAATVALLVTLDRLAPSERLAFVLHYLLGVPFEEVAAAIGRSPDDAQRLAERARHTVQHGEPANGDHARRSQTVEAFLSGARTAGLGDVLDPQVVLRSDRTAAATGVTTVRGAAEVGGAVMGRASSARPALIDGVPGAVWTTDGSPTLAFLFSVVDSRIVDIELVADPHRLAGMQVDLSDEPST